MSNMRSANTMTADTNPEKPKVIQLSSRQLTAEDVENIEASMENARNVKLAFCQEVVDFAQDQLRAIFASYGIDMTGSRVDRRDLVMIEQTIYGLLHRYYRMEHPIHQVTDATIVFTVDGEEEMDEDEDLLTADDEEITIPLDEMEPITENIQ